MLWFIKRDKDHIPGIGADMIICEGCWKKGLALICHLSAVICDCIRKNVYIIFY